MNSIKIVTICGSMKFKKEMMQIVEELELKNGYAVIQCIYGSNYAKEDEKKLEKIHFKKINISDAIYVVNVNGYIGDATKKRDRIC